MKHRRSSICNILLIAVLVFMNVCRNFLWLLPSALMSPIMNDLNLNYTQAGQLIMIVTVMMGMFLIFGSMILGKTGPIVAMCLA